jgi:nitrate/TMAO reductase-like tetraheme cytochrome c subunit
MEKDDIIKSSPTTNEKYGVPLNARVDYEMASKITKEAKSLEMTLSTFLNIIIATGWQEWSGANKSEQEVKDYSSCMNKLLSSQVFRKSFKSEISREFRDKMGVEIDDSLKIIVDTTLDNLLKRINK